MRQTTLAERAPAAARARADRHPQLDERRRRHLRLWFWSGAALTFVILVIGGITRLTQSGLSIVDWRPLMGVVPPLTDAQWQEAFDSYRRFPEYQLLRQGMTLEEFKFIFFWEYIHRVFARLIGVVFLVPFAVFWLRGYFDRPLLRRALFLFGLGALQGLAGWYMVKSGLVDRPHVSHFRLGIHLSIAFAIFGCCVWFALDLRSSRPWVSMSEAARRVLLRGLYTLGALLALQVFWGALVAGLKAGRLFNTFPRMGGAWIPPNVLGLEPAWLNLVENPITVQWLHRLLGTVLGLAAIVFFLRVRRLAVDGVVQRLNAAFLVLILVQYGLGVLTLLYHVPVSLGVLHQATAMLIFGVWLAWLHVARHGASGLAPARPA